MKNILIISLIAFLVSCTHDNSKSKYLRWVGDSKYNPEIDTTDFKLCNSESLVKQYFHFDNGLKYKQGKKELRNRIKEQYIPVESPQCGWIRIRFIVNCKGGTGRFRIMGSDANYEEQVFDSRITVQLMEITKSLDGWMIQSQKSKPQDYYQYLIFKIDKGDVIEILP